MRIRARHLGAVLLAVCLPFAGCGRPDDTPRLNIVLISIDSLRADHLGCYGYERDTSPAIDALGAESTLFRNAISQAPWTLPSHASLLTSLYSRTHGADDPDRQLPPTAATLASTLRSAGYSTHGVVSGVFMHSRFGFATGFDSYDDNSARGGHRLSHGAVTSPDTNARAAATLDTVEPPFFLFVHYWDVHYDYIPPAPYDTKFDPDYDGSVTAEHFMKNPEIHREMDSRDLQHVVALYDGEIGWVDEHIGKLIAELKRRELWDDTIVVLTSDHGDEFFEHGEKGHQHSLYQELLHVPLIVRVPGFAARQVDARVELIDVMPTLLDLVSVSAPSGLQGRSLAPVLRGEALEPRPAFAETTKTRKDRDVLGKSDSSCV